MKNDKKDTIPNFTFFNLKNLILIKYISKHKYTLFEGRFGLESQHSTSLLWVRNYFTDDLITLSHVTCSFEIQTLTRTGLGDYCHGNGAENRNVIFLMEVFEN